MTRNPIACDVPFDTDGKHHGFLRLPYSRDDSAWGSVMIPITVTAMAMGRPRCLPAGATATNTRDRWPSRTLPANWIRMISAAG